MVSFTKFDAHTKNAFPIFTNWGNDFVYLDSAATAQKPSVVLDAMRKFYEYSNANPHRGISRLATEAEQVHDSAREAVREFINATNTRNIIFTKNTTESINVAAFGWAHHNVKKDDEIVVTELEHHANLIPWQQVAAHTGAKLRFIPVNSEGNVDVSSLDTIITPKTKLVAVAHVSNVFGNTLPLADIIKQAKKVGAAVLIDGAQAVAHQKVDVQELGCDFYAFSGHKMYGPMGIGVLYASDNVLASMQPINFGGSMINRVTYESATWAEAPFKFEAGTQDVAAAVGLEAAIGYLKTFSWTDIRDHDAMLYQKTRQLLTQHADVVVYTSMTDTYRTAISFNYKNIHPHDVGQILDEYGIVVRVGHHCAQPLMTKLGISGTVRVSFGLYNTEQDLSQIPEALKKVEKVFHGSR